MLFQRYSSPLELLDLMIATGRLYEFVREVINIRNDEMVEQTSWEFWLHKVFDQSWADFRNEIPNDNSSTTAAPTQEELKKTVSDSANMLKNFCPYSGGEQGGTVQTIGDNSG